MSEVNSLINQNIGYNCNFYLEYKLYFDILYMTFPHCYEINCGKSNIIDIKYPINFYIKMDIRISLIGLLILIKQINELDDDYCFDLLNYYTDMFKLSFGKDIKYCVSGTKGHYVCKFDKNNPFKITKPETKYFCKMGIYSTVFLIEDSPCFMIERYIYYDFDCVFDKPSSLRMIDIYHNLLAQKI